MLVLSRKLDESLRIGDIRVTIVRILNGAVRMGIEAPAELNVVREELVRRPGGRIRRKGKARD